jgi:peptide/nickel transport system permease protein
LTAALENEVDAAAARAAAVARPGVWARLLRHTSVVIGIGIALLIGGVVITESVYNIPGIGRLTVDAVLARDFPVIQIVIMMFSFVYVLVNLLIDLAYSVLDPRIRY